MARDHVGDVMMVSCVVMARCIEVDVAEALAARHGLQIALEAGLTKIILETDCLKLYYSLQRRNRENNMFGAVVNDILVLADKCNAISFSHIRRSGNKPAHLLAKSSMKYQEPRVWIEEAPFDVMKLVMEDLNIS